MSPASYRTAPPRVAGASLRVAGGGLKSRSAQQVEGLGDLDPGAVAELDPFRAAALGVSAVGGGEVGLGLLEQRSGLGPVALGGLLVPVTGRRGLVGWRRRAGHVSDRVDEGVAD